VLFDNCFHIDYSCYVFAMKRILKALVYSLQGLKATFVSEPAFRQEILLAVVLVPFAFWLDVTVVERVLLISSVVLVLMAELVNTAVEAVVDRISDAKHVLSGKAKDVGSALVLVALVHAAVVWLLILL